MVNNKIFSVPELAAILKIPARRIAYMARVKILPASRAFGKICFTEKMLRRKLPSLYIGSSFVQPCHFSDQWLTASDLALAMKCSMATVLRRTRKRQIPFYRFGKHTLRFRLAEILAHIESQVNKGRH